MTLTVRGKPVPTTATEFRLLDYFMRHAGRVFTRDQLLDSVWRDTAYVTPRSVDVYVRRIREKIEPDPETPRYLTTVRGPGTASRLGVEKPHFFKLMFVFLLVIGATAITLQQSVHRVWERTLREQIKLNLKQKTLIVCASRGNGPQYSLAVITSQEGQAAGARATVIDPTGKVLADSEADPSTMENHAHRKEFVTAWAGKSASMSATVKR